MHVDHARRAPSATLGGLSLPLMTLAAATLLALLSTLQSAFWLDYGGSAVPWAGLLKARLGEWYIYALFMAPLAALARRVPIGATPLPQALLIYGAVSLLLPLLKEEMFVQLGNWFRPGAFRLGDILAEDYASELFTFWALIAVAHLLAARQPRPSAPPSTAGCQPSFFVVTDGALRRRIAAEDVRWIDAQGNYARLNTAGGGHLVRETMDGLERRLGSRFVRIHRATLVNAAAIDRIERRPRGGLAVALRCGTVLAVGRSYRSAVRSLRVD